MYNLVAIGCERNIAGIPVCNLPANASADDKATALEIGKKIKTAEAGAIVEPNGYAWRWMESGRSVADAMPVIEHHGVEMARSVLAQFLNLGATRYGSQALSTDQRSLFFISLNAFADWICDLFNLYVIPQICAFNWPKLTALPVMAHSDMSNLMAPDMLAKVIQMLSQGGGLAPDDPFLAYVRDAFGMPEPDPTTAIDRSPSVSAGIGERLVAASEPAGCVHQFEEDRPGGPYRFAASMNLPEVRRRLSGMKTAGDRALGEVLSSQLSGLQQRITAILEGDGDQARKYAALMAISVPAMSKYREELHGLMVSAAGAGMQAAAKQSGGEPASFPQEFDALVAAEVDAIARRYQETVRFSVVKPVLDDLSRGLDVKTVLWNLAQNCKRAMSNASAESVDLGMEHAGAVVNAALAGSV
jgi:hypothetical protein